MVDQEWPSKSWKVNSNVPLSANKCQVAFNQVISSLNQVMVAKTSPLVDVAGSYKTVAVGIEVSIVKALTNNRLLGLLAISVT